MLRSEFKLFDHQKIATEFALRNNGNCALYMDIGTGKTLTALSVFSKLRENEPSLKMLVICPLSLIETAWGNDIKNFTTFSYCNLRGKFEIADIFISNFELLISRKGEAILSPLLGLHKWLCVIDESSRMKNHKSKTTKQILNLRRSVKYCIVMSGSPAPNGDWEFWPQLSFVQPGVLGGSFFGFRNHFFHLARNGQKLPAGSLINKSIAAKIFKEGWKYEITKEKKEQLLARIKPVCFFVKKEDCLDLPEQIDEIREIEMNAEQKRIYNGMKEDLVAEIKNQQIAAPVALTKIMKLRQICSGFIIDEQSKALEIEGNPKLKELESFLDEVGDDQAIIWCEFRKEVADIQNLLGDRCVILDGTVTEKNEPIEKFKAGQVRYLIANSQSMSHGVTLVNASVQIFYSLSYSYERYEQCRGRTHRFGQTRSCVYIHLLTKDSIEEVILKVLRKKGDAQQMVEAFLK